MEIRKINIYYFTLPLLLIFSCSKEVSEEAPPVETVIENTVQIEKEYFEKRKDSLRQELNYKLQDIKIDIEEVDLKLYDYGDELDNQSKQSYIQLLDELNDYKIVLENRLDQIDNQTERKWEQFVLNVKLDWNSSKLKMKEIRINLHAKMKKAKKVE